ncbi:MAG: hypothetical protein LIO96_00610, partial [Lachnospiraceae bacterium]|nr:hypothetical protein [Lachnospiraceae bacterium]
MAFQITEVRVNQMKNPLGLDEKNPLFSWRFRSGEPDMRQSGAHIRVRRKADGEVFWDSGILETSRSIGIRYEGKALMPETAYDVLVGVWNEKKETAAAVGEFETGLMDPTPAAWEGAEWIGAPEYYLASDTVSVFVIESTLEITEGDRAGIVFGANDPRLLDAEKNELGVAGENYFCFAVNIRTIPAAVEIIRVGYDAAD